MLAVFMFKNILSSHQEVVKLGKKKHFDLFKERYRHKYTY